MVQDLGSQVQLQGTEGTQDLPQELHSHLVEPGELGHQQVIDGQLGVHGSLLIVAHTAHLTLPLLDLLVVQQLVQALLDQLLGPLQHV